MTPQEIEIANHEIAGIPRAKIGAAVNLSETSVRRHLDKAEVADYIASAKEQLISQSLPKAVSNINHAINSYQDKESDKLLRDHGYKASITIAESVGILPSHAGSINIAGDVVITPVIAQIMQQFSQTLATADNAEVEGNDIDTDSLGVSMGVSNDKAIEHSK